MAVRREISAGVVPPEGESQFEFWLSYSSFDLLDVLVVTDFSPPFRSFFIRWFQNSARTDNSEKSASEWPQIRTRRRWRFFCDFVNPFWPRPSQLRLDGVLPED